MRFYPFVFTGEVPCKEVRTPLNSITFNEERDEETCYGYCNDYQPHAVKRMFDYKNGMLYDMRWDEAGNLGQVSIAKLGDMFEAGRFLFWTEDNRMHAAVDDRYFSYYAYDHSGGSCGSREQSQACLSYAEMEQRRRSQRRLKLTGENKLLDVNADFMATYTILNEPTLYPSAYMVLTNKGYTKHYYAGTERVAARLGGGGLDALYHVIGNDVELQKKADILFKQSLGQVNHRVLHENNLDCIMHNEFARDEFGKRIDGIPYQVRSDVKVDNWQFKDMVHSMLVDLNNGHEKEVYFYHSDHLGSASWITDYRGMAVQHIQYLPYGEPYINQRPFGYSERFTFTGKEKDEETGYGYFGARYMDHELMTMWLSVDPMSDKYPSISPYAYCAWNPVKLVDPDGREFGNYYSESGALLGTDGINDGKVYIVPFKEGQKKVKNGEYDVEKYELPTIQVREQMCDYLESSDNENNLREYGGAIWEYEDDSQNQELRCASPGPIWSGGSYGSIDVMEYGNDEYNASGKKPLTYFHSHFSGKINGIGLKQWPSDAFDGDPHDFKRGDIQNVLNEQGGRMGGARLPYNIMVAMRDKKVFLYTQHGVKCIMDINVFKTVGGPAQ